MTNLIQASSKTGSLNGSTSAIVAGHATNTNALDRAGLALLGVFGPAGKLRALVRLPGGRIRRVETGQRLSLGRVVAIDAGGMMVQVNGRTRRIGMPGG